MKIHTADKSWTAIGYPVNYGHKGFFLQKVNGSKGKIFDFVDSQGNVISKVVQMLDNPMLEGSSGGAWIAKLNASKKGYGNYAVGLNSFGYTEEPTITYGPYFDKKVFKLLNKVKNSCHIQ
ncbi:hypothetical protein [Xylella fastidiosa]|uniref:hypothetical protein n=1 Tax=Xylella fastidiosa TaxID=2371 RepID=UPI00118157ED|nr:hypothetical protein [Xylella fastidiosa]WGZ32828.1 hypothetical protein O4444_04280 [Xylella fastidiosa subsp. pauca]WGZ33368.1 hypothetical protein O4445_06685 [Xylella fastidiosa subsp. pauca]WGZ35693.1 hypothetical protein O4443_06665 [Xylella fastidiosa subsp. pauca]